MGDVKSSLEELAPEAQTTEAYVPPGIDQVLQPGDLEREVAYAGLELVSYLP